MDTGDSPLHNKWNDPFINCKRTDSINSLSKNKPTNFSNPSNRNCALTCCCFMAFSID